MENWAFHPLPQWKKRFPLLPQTSVSCSFCAAAGKEGCGNIIQSLALFSLLPAIPLVSIKTDKASWRFQLSTAAHSGTICIYSGKSHLGERASAMARHDGRRNRLPPADCCRHRASALSDVYRAGPPPPTTPQKLFIENSRGLMRDNEIKEKRNARAPVRVQFLFFRVLILSCTSCILSNQVSCRVQTTQLSYIYIQSNFGELMTLAPTASRGVSCLSILNAALYRRCARESFFSVVLSTRRYY